MGTAAVRARSCCACAACPVLASSTALEGAALLSARLILQFCWGLDAVVSVQGVRAPLGVLGVSSEHKSQRVGENSEPIS